MNKLNIINAYVAILIVVAGAGLRNTIPTQLKEYKFIISEENVNILLKTDKSDPYLLTLVLNNAENYLFVHLVKSNGLGEEFISITPTFLSKSENHYVFEIDMNVKFSFDYVRIGQTDFSGNKIWQRIFNPINIK